MLRNVLSNPFLFRHWLVRHNVSDIRVVCVNRLQRLPIATIKQCGCSRNSRSSWRFWIVHYFRKRFDRISRMLTGGILNIGHNFWPSVRISRLSWPKACAVCSFWHCLIVPVKQAS
jgi:hypothetical protein